MSYSKSNLDQQYIFTIVDDSENKIKEQKATITIFDNYLKIKFRKHKNKKLDYYSIYQWILNKYGNMIKIQYKSRKDGSYRLLTFTSDDESAEQLNDYLLEHCQFIADVTKERK
jgi:hypothetical protein